MKQEAKERYVIQRADRRVRMGLLGITPGGSVKCTAGYGADLRGTVVNHNAGEVRICPSDLCYLPCAKPEVFVRVRSARCTGLEAVCAGVSGSRCRANRVVANLVKGLKGERDTAYEKVWGRETGTYFTAVQ